MAKPDMSSCAKFLPHLNINNISKLFQREMIQSKIFDESIDFPFISENAKIDVYLLEATVEAIENVINDGIKCLAGVNGIKVKGLNSRDDYIIPNFISPNTYHTGIGFVYRNSNVEFVLQYFAKVGLINAFMPIIGDDNSITWKNQTVIGYDDYIDRSYWEKATYIGTVTNSKLLKIRKMILEDFVPKNSFYRYLDYYKLGADMVTASDSPADTVFVTQLLKNTTPKLKKSTCDTFAYFVIDCMKRLESPIKFITSPRETIGIIIGGSEPVILDESKDSDKKLIIDYYKDLAQRIDTIKKKAIQNILKKLSQLCAQPDDPSRKKPKELQQICDIITKFLPHPEQLKSEQLKSVYMTKTPENNLEKLKNFLMAIGNVENIEPFIPTFVLSLNDPPPSPPKNPLTYIIYYGQDDDGNAHYYKIDYVRQGGMIQSPAFYTNYVISDLNRNIPFKDINKQQIQTEFVDENENAKNEDKEGAVESNNWGMYILAVLLLVIFIMLCSLRKK